MCVRVCVCVCVCVCNRTFKSNYTLSPQTKLNKITARRFSPLFLLTVADFEGQIHVPVGHANLRVKVKVGAFLGHFLGDLGSLFAGQLVGTLGLTLANDC